MKFEDRQKLCRAVADALTLDTEGIMAHFSHCDFNGKTEPTLFAFTQARVFTMDIDDNAILTLTPKMPIEAIKGVPVGKTTEQAKSLFPPPAKFDLMNPNVWPQIAAYIKSIPIHQYNKE